MSWEYYSTVKITDQPAWSCHKGSHKYSSSAIGAKSGNLKSGIFEYYNLYIELVSIDQLIEKVRIKQAYSSSAFNNFKSLIFLNSKIDNCF